MDEIQRLQRLAKLEQSMVDHLETCDRRYTDLWRGINDVKTKVIEVESMLSDRAWGVMKSLIGLLILMMVGMVSYIWIDHVGNYSVRVIYKDKTYVPGSKPQSQPRLPALQRERDRFDGGPTN